jgi:hypothetical protein
MLLKLRLFLVQTTYSDCSLFRLFGLFKLTVRTSDFALRRCVMEEYDGCGVDGSRTGGDIGS